MLRQNLKQQESKTEAKGELFFAIEQNKSHEFNHAYYNCCSNQCKFIESKITYST